MRMGGRTKCRMAKMTKREGGPIQGWRAEAPSESKTEEVIRQQELTEIRGGLNWAGCVGRKSIER